MTKKGSKIMTKAKKIEYILKYQVNLDERCLEDFPKIPYTKEELNEMECFEVTEVFNDVLQAEQLTANLYEAEVLKHGRSE